MSTTRWLTLALVTLVGPIAIATPVRAQQQKSEYKNKHKDEQQDEQQDEASAKKEKGPKLYRASATKAVSVTRTVLERQGYTVVRVERVGVTRVVYYRRGNRGRGKGKGPLQKMVIRTVKDRVVFEDTAPELLVDIDIKLRL